MQVIDPDSLFILGESFDCTLNIARNGNFKLQPRLKLNEALRVMNIVRRFQERFQVLTQQIMLNGRAIQGYDHIPT